MNGNRKGKVGEREFAKFCKSHGFKDARRSQQYCGNTGEAADVVGLPGVTEFGVPAPTDEDCLF